MLISKILFSPSRRGLTALSKAFPVLPDTLSQASDTLLNAGRKSSVLLQQLEEINAVSYAGGGTKGIELHVKKNRKVLPRDRILMLLDEESDKLELSLQAGIGMVYGDIPAASSICVIGKIHNVFCMVSANDGTMKGGTIFPVTLSKNLRAMSISHKNFLPSVVLVDSGGGFLPLQSEFFADRNHGGRTFYGQAVGSSAGIPQLALVCGSCTAGGAYAPTMCEDAAIVERVGTIFLGGPPLVKAATGEEVSAQDLGGASLHCFTSGCTDYYAATEEEGMEILRDVIATLNVIPEEGHPVADDCLAVPDELCGLEVINTEMMKGLIGRLLDGRRFREFKHGYGKHLITGYGFINKKLVGVLANIGALDANDSLKGAHFIQICEHRKIPLIFLQNSGPVHQWNNFYKHLCPEEMGVTLKCRAAMIGALSCSSVGKVAVNVGSCLGDDNYTMCGPSFEPNFIFSWPGTTTSHTLNPPSRPLPSEEKEPRKIKTQSSFNFPQESCWFHASHVLNDGIIKPSETRKILDLCLKIISQKDHMEFSQKKFPVLRL